jgi:hypothetical protein
VKYKGKWQENFLNGCHKNEKAAAKAALIKLHHAFI